MIIDKDFETGKDVYETILKYMKLKTTYEIRIDPVVGEDGEYVYHLMMKADCGEYDPLTDEEISDLLRCLVEDECRINYEDDLK